MKGGGGPLEFGRRGGELCGGGSGGGGGGGGAEESKPKPKALKQLGDPNVLIFASITFSNFNIIFLWPKLSYI